MIEVAVGVLVDKERRVLIARRPDDVHQGGLWEFPGGKIETGETVGAALARELSEELGIMIDGSRPLLTVNHDYGDKQVTLRVELVECWQGEPFGAEGQPLAWVAISALERYAFPEANRSIVECLLRLER